MSDETKSSDPIERIRAVLTELFPPPDPGATAAAEERTDELVKAQMAANEERFAKELAFRERMVAEQLRAETAATILAALIQGTDGGVTESRAHSYARMAVALADALRAELAEAKP